MFASSQTQVHTCTIQATRCDSAALSVWLFRCFCRCARVWALDGEFAWQRIDTFKKHVIRSGERLHVPAMVGQSLYAVAVEHQVIVGDSFSCHVILDPESYALHPPPLVEEIEELERLTEIERTATSRIASFLELSSAVPETICALGDVRDYDIP